MPINAAVIDRLKAQLLTSGIQGQNQPLFQVINQLIDALRETTSAVTSGAFTGSGTGTGSGGVGPAGPQGIPGATNIPCLDGEDGVDGISNIPGQIGPAGLPGIQGLTGMGIPGLDAEEAEAPYMIPGPPGVGGAPVTELLTAISYNPNPAVLVTNSTTTAADVDATNLAVTFIAPTSGRVIVRMSAAAIQSGASATVWCLRDTSGTVIPGSRLQVTGDTSWSRPFYFIHISGLSPNVSYTWRWAFFITGVVNTTTIGYGEDPTLTNPRGPATMEVWAVASGNSASNGPILIAQQTPTGVNSVTFSALGAYTHLDLLWVARCDVAAISALPTVTFNGDTGSNYDSISIYGSASGPFATEALAGVGGSLGAVPGASAAANFAVAGTLRLYDYRGTAFQKSGLVNENYRRDTVTTAQFTRQISIAWRNTVAITSLTVTLSAGNFVAGTKFSLYGIP